ncbi:hypothetical protein [Comamonas composti]|uniref:hypothetical protein n=1 Tax=Comamonas composti TaxID=408558 RepID=UPI000424613B|nr:hypothetical protein [Comamonas composti]
MKQGLRGLAAGALLAACAALSACAGSTPRTDDGATAGQAGGVTVFGTVDTNVSHTR